MSYKRVTFAARPGAGSFDPAKTFKTEEASIPLASDVPQGAVLVKVNYTSCDPAMRGWMNDARSYVKPLDIGETMRASTAGVVVLSKSSHFNTGDKVVGGSGWTEYAVVTEPEKSLRKVDSSAGVPLKWYLGVLGMVAQTAYWGLLDVGKPVAGETVVVSGAAGATGLVAVQIAKIKGCRVVAIAGGPEKCKWLHTELGVDVALDYKSESFRKDFAKATPNYVNVYFDNVGGDILNLVLTRLAQKARIVVCGAVSQYNATAATAKGPTNYLTLISQRAKMEGFIVFDYAKRYAEAEKELSQWIKDGKLKSQDTIVKGGVEKAPRALLDLFEGKNTGKMIVEVAPEESRPSL